MAKPEFVLLAQVFDPKKHLAASTFMSEKLDGFRGFWDGGISRGLPKEEVPWANLDKDVTPNQIATGLWTRYGNIIHAPDFFIDALPQFMLDGEIWGGREMFQTVRSICSKLPENRIDSDWEKVWYKVFDIPSPEQVFKPRTINIPNFRKTIPSGALSWAQKRLKVVPKARVFQNVLMFLKHNLLENSFVKLHQQTQLPFNTEKALEQLYEKLDEVVAGKGEGMILRRAQSTWIPERSYDLLKVKKFKDDEATVVGYVTGRETEKGSKLRGLMGALIVDYKGKRFELAGFNSEERVLICKNDPEPMVPHTALRTFEGADYETKPILVEPKAFRWAYDNPSPPNGPGTKVPEDFMNPVFPIGSQVTFKYTELSDDGFPKVASYWRKP